MSGPVPGCKDVRGSGELKINFDNLLTDCGSCSRIVLHSTIQESSWWWVMMCIIALCNPLVNCSQYVELVESVHQFYLADVAGLFSLRCVGGLLLFRNIGWQFQFDWLTIVAVIIFINKFCPGAVFIRRAVKYAERTTRRAPSSFAVICDLHIKC